MKKGTPVFELRPPAFWEGALCAQTDPDLFYPDETSVPQLIEKAKSICERCPLKEPCLDEAMHMESITYGKTSRHGIWGGLTAIERHRLGRKQRKEGAA